MVRDSGLTDSKLMRVQKYIQDKHEKYIEDKSRDANIEQMKQRFDSGAKPPESKKGLWEIIKGLF